MTGWAIVLLIAAAASPEQFNLACTGTTETIEIGGGGKAPYSRTLRIDLATRQWCAGSCTAVEPIARIEPGRILLRDERHDRPRGGYSVERESVNRVTGDHSGLAATDPRDPNGHSISSKGHCEVAPFTGFVDGKTQF